MAGSSAPLGFRPRLLQARLDSDTVAAGTALSVTYWWQNRGDAPCPGTERVFVHVRRRGQAEDAPDAVRLGGDHDPPVPTYRWRPGRLVVSSSAVSIPEHTPPGGCVGTGL